MTPEQSAMEVDSIKPQEKKNSKIKFGKNHKTKTFTQKKIDTNISSDSNVSNAEEKIKFSPVTMFIPRQVQQKTFANALTGNMSMKKNVLESKSLMELEESLPNT